MCTSITSSPKWYQHSYNLQKSKVQFQKWGAIVVAEAAVLVDFYFGHSEFLLVQSGLAKGDQVIKNLGKITNNFFLLTNDAVVLSKNLKLFSMLLSSDILWSECNSQNYTWTTSDYNVISQLFFWTDIWLSFDLHCALYFLFHKEMNNKNSKLMISLPISVTYLYSSNYYCKYLKVPSKEKGLDYNPLIRCNFSLKYKFKERK